MLEKGEILENRYKVFEILKIGSKGAVYFALDLHLPGKSCTIKEFFTSEIPAPEDGEASDDIQDRAGYLSQLEHINFPRLTDFFMCEQNSYLVFDYIDGKSLKSLIDSKRCLEEEPARNYILQLANTAVYVKKKLLSDIFIDFKPENILVTSDNTLKFVDFGILKSSGCSRLYQSEFLIDYIKEPSDINDDFVVMGIMFYYLLTGNFKFPLSLEQETISPEAKKIISKCLNGEYTDWESLIYDIGQKESFSVKEIFNDHEKETLPVIEDKDKTEVLKEARNIEKKDEFFDEPPSSPDSSDIDIKDSKFYFKSSVFTLILYGLVIFIIANIAGLYISLNMEGIEKQDEIDHDFISPLEPEFLKDRAMYYYSLEDYSRALSLFKRHILKYPSDGESHVYLCNSQALEMGSELIYIGLAVPVTGDDSQTGQAIMQGVAMAIKKINSAGGINGRKVVCIIKDDNPASNDTKNIAEDFVEDERIVAVIGHGRSVSTLAAAEVYNKGKISHLSPVSTSPEVLSAGDYTFVTCPSDVTQGKTLADIAENYLKAKRVATIYNLYEPYCSGLTFSFKSSLKADIVLDETYETGDMDFSGQAEKLVKASPDLIFIGGYDREALAIIKELRDKGFKGDFIGGDALYTQKLLEAGQDAVNGLICTTFFYPDLSDSQVKAFMRKFGKLFGGGTPNPIAAQAYDTAGLLFYVMSDSSCDREDIRERLSMVGSKLDLYKGIVGVISFDKNGGAEKHWQVVKIQNGKYVSL